MPFVLDTSVTMAWAFDDEVTSYAKAVLDALDGERALVPGIWPLEVANVLLVGERRGRITPARTGSVLSDFSVLPIEVDQERPARVWGAVLTIGRAHGLSAYDASYLELALRLALPLATQDNRLRSVAALLGVPIFVPDQPASTTDARSPNGA
jgi:predicted nucleic acid-binding protein